MFENVKQRFIHIRNKLMWKQAMLTKEAQKKLDQDWKVEVEIEVNGVKQKFILAPPPDPKEEEEKKKQEEQQQQQQQPQPPQPPQPPQQEQPQQEQQQGQPQQNWYGQPLKPQPATPYNWKRKSRLEALQRMIEGLSPDQDLMDAIHQWGWAGSPPPDLERDENEEIDAREKRKNRLGVDQEEALHQIRRILRDNLYERRVLDKRWRVETNRLAYYKTSRKIFSKKTWEQWKNYHFEILVDVSDSMFSDNTIRPAIEATLHTARILNDVAHIRIKLFWDIPLLYTLDEFEWLVESFVEWGSQRDFQQKIWNWFEVHDQQRRELHVVHESEVSWYKSMWWYKIWHWRKVCSWTYEPWPVLSSFEHLRRQDWEKCLLIMHDWWYNSHSYWDLMQDWREVELWWDRATQCFGRYNQDEYKKAILDAQAEGIHVQSIGIKTDRPKDYWWEKNFEYIANSSEIFWVLVSSFQRMTWKK